MRRNLYVLAFIIFVLFCVSVTIAPNRNRGPNHPSQTLPTGIPQVTPEVYALNHYPNFYDMLSKDAPQELRNIQPDDLDSLVCMTDSESSGNIRRLTTLESGDIHFEPRLISALEQLNKDAPNYFDGVKNPGDDEIVAGFRQICRNENTKHYYILFYSMPDNYMWLSQVNKNVQAGGGGGPGDPHLAVLKEDGSLAVYPRLGTPKTRLSFNSKIFEMRKTTTPYEGEPTPEYTEVYRQSAAYYSCGRVAGFTDNELYLSCGGGDGGGGSTSMAKVNVQTGEQNDVYLCVYSVGNAWCKDENNREYIKRVKTE